MNVDGEAQTEHKGVLQRLKLLRDAAIYFKGVHHRWYLQRRQRRRVHGDR